MEQSEVREQSPLRTLYYWAALFVTLLVVDDLTFGWIFWGISQFNLLASAVAALVIYWGIGYWVTLRGLSPNPGKWASKLLNWLQLDHSKNPELHLREEQLQAKITSVAVAVPMSLLFGGVFTTLWLLRRNVINDHRARRVAIWLTGLFALEVAAIHAVGIGGLILFLRHTL